MFRLAEDILYVDLPSGKTQAELVTRAMIEIDNMSEQLYGLDLSINGRITTGMALVLGHKLAHICKSVSIFDPKEKDYITCVLH